LAFIYI